MIEFNWTFHLWCCCSLHEGFHQNYSASSAFHQLPQMNTHIYCQLKIFNFILAHFECRSVCIKHAHTHKSERNCWKVMEWNSSEFLYIFRDFSTQSKFYKWKFHVVLQSSSNSLQVYVDYFFNKKIFIVHFFCISFHLNLLWRSLKMKKICVNVERIMKLNFTGWVCGIFNAIFKGNEIFFWWFLLKFQLNFYEREF